ncbi:NAD(P)-dependent oxidoreductase [Modestobacter versicolor]|uniref:3-hydroxyisobutyrate dehydrogenase n=1 Tax=Modestobacter versicolor TaxID=429133 RepID=A0A323V6I1_9ACTN|nr:NAD(P)-dependent oxidoreductase [Modestobacter versicolor]MBB3676737.1 3-hydroxyisobutyrate dehydrogenase [Modestobacter versicolor]PZA20439.1 NAD(P)-dependent oxidoreductase [Modestobacter versicolor]
MSNPVVAVLGTGTMGAGMVRSLRRAGLPVRVWNRAAAKAQALAGTGAQACGSPAEAVAGADVVLTMLFDADAAIDVVRQAAPPAGTTWLQCSTVGVDGAGRTAEVAAELGLVLVDCPVLGTKQPAEDGALVLLASGPEETREQLAPVFDALGSKTLWLGEAGAGSRLKMACNAWLFMVTAGTAQSIALARGLGVDPQHFLDAIAGGPLDTPYAHVKGELMMAGEFPVSFGLTGAAKDARLIRAALQQAGVSDRLDAAVLETMDAAAAALADPAAADVSAVIAGLQPRG